MIFSNERQDLRQVYFITWRKYQNKEILGSVEQQVLQVILDHPEYQRFIENSERYLDKDFFEESDGVNPFLHMGLHLGLREQINTNRPAGINKIYQQLVQQYRGDHLSAEHDMMHCLAIVMQQAQIDHKEPNVENYMQLLNNLK